MFLSPSPRAISVSNYAFDSNQHAASDAPPPNARPSRMFVHDANPSIDNHDDLLIALLERIAQRDDAALKRRS